MDTTPNRTSVPSRKAVERLADKLSSPGTTGLDIMAAEKMLRELLAEVERLTKELKRLDDKWYPDTIAGLDHLANVMRQRDEARATVTAQAAALALLWREHEFYHYEGCPADTTSVEDDCTRYHGHGNKVVVAALASQRSVPREK